MTQSHIELKPCLYHHPQNSQQTLATKKSYEGSPDFAQANQEEVATKEELQVATVAMARLGSCWFLPVITRQRWRLLQNSPETKL